MRKLFSTILISGICSMLFSQQLTISSAYYEIEPDPLSGLNHVFVFRSLDTPMPASITYQATSLSYFKWLSFDETGYDPEQDPVLDDPNKTSTTFNLDGNGSLGYILKVYDPGDTKKAKDSIQFWVIDYSAVRSEFNELSWEEMDDKCDFLKLIFDVNSPEMAYFSTSGSKFVINREYTLFYESLKWDADKKEYESITPSLTQRNILEEISVEAPLKHTKFYLLDDQFSIHFGYRDTLKSELYSAIAVDAHLITKVIVRDALNEIDKEILAEGNVKGSAPLDLNFTSNSNKYENQLLKYFEWLISTSKNFSNATYRYPDENLNFTFNQTGTYYVKITVSNDFCSKSDSVQLEVLESLLQIPNVFTPNGDGINDEFRVAYKSLVKFQGWIFSRWGEKVFEWTDPAKGWDGYFRGKLAAPGAYYYIIEAEGSDEQKYKRKGDINLLRGKESK